MTDDNRARIDAILATLDGGPDLRENILAAEVLRLRAERAALRAERAALRAKVDAAAVDAQANWDDAWSPYYEGRLDALGSAQRWMDGDGEGDDA